MSKKKIVLWLSAGTALAALGVTNVFADVDTMTGTGTSGGYGTSGGTGITCEYGKYGGNNYVNPENVDCMGWSWVYYKYIGGSAHEGEGMYFSPYHANYGVNSSPAHSSGAWISDKCAQENRGFWHMGRNFEVEHDSGSGPGSSGFTSTKHDIIHRDTYTRAFVNSFWDGSDKARLEVTDTWAAESGHQAKMWYKGKQILLNQYDSPLATYNPYLDRTLVLNHTLTNNGVPMYQAMYFGKDSEVRAIYEQETGSTMGNNVWGFCSYGNDVPDPDPDIQTYNASVNLKVHTSSGITSSTNGNVVDIWSSDGEVHEVNTSTLYYRGFGIVTAEDAESAQQNTSYTVTISDTSSPTAKSSQSFDVNDTASGPSERTLTLVPGVEYTICANNTYASKYNSEEDPKFSSRVPIEACTKVKYDIDCVDFLKDDGTAHKVSEFENYGRMKISGKGDLSVGDGASADSGEYWVTKENAISLRYYGCMGLQAYNDGNGGGEIIYSIDNNISGLYENTNNYVASNSRSGQSVSGYELNLVGTRWSDNGPGKSNTIADRVHAGYQFGGDSSLAAVTTSKTTQTGTSNKKTLSWKKKDGSTKEVSITVNNPYNYYLKPSISGLGSGKVVIDSEIVVGAQINKKPRSNTKLNSIDSNPDTKTTTTWAWLFTISSGKDLDDLNAAIMADGTIKRDGDFFIQGNQGDAPINKMTGLLESMDSIKDYKSNFAIGDNVTLKTSIGSDEAVGTKICAMVAAWPADSHNILPTEVDNNYTITDDDQTNALIGDNAGSNPYWRFSVSCNTVGKYPGISVEGSSLIVNGGVETRTTQYKNGVFGSWSEYDIVSTSAKNIGSGASLAYSIHDPQTEVNQPGDIDNGGLRGGTIDAPQTLGNIETSYGTNEASLQFASSKRIIDNIEAYCDDTGKCEKRSGSLNQGDNNGFYLYDGGFPITDDIINESKNSILVIIADNVTISNNVKRIDAVIIAKNSFDTCSEASKNALSGNQELLQNCNNPLVINGAVYKGGAGELNLDRAFGGGSLGEDKLDPATLLQRSEIFNYDARIVNVANRIVQNFNSTDTQYVRELAPRL